MRKETRVWFCFIIFIIGFFALTQGGCGGGGGGTADSGGGDETAGTLTSANAPQTTGAVIQAVNLVGVSSALGGIQPASSSAGARVYSKPPLVSLLDGVVSISKRQRHKTGLHTAGSLPATTEVCSDGGSATVNVTWTGPDNPTDASQIVDLQANMIVNSCKEDTVTMNGAMSVRFDGPLSSFSKITITTTNLSFSDSATSDSMIMNLTMTVTNFTLSGDELTGATIAITGSISGNASGKPINVQCDGYTMAFSSNSSGTAVSVSGNIKPVCLKGWITITTNTPLFIPQGAACPTAGDIVAAAGADSVRVVVASDSKITVYFNGSVVQTYTSCQDVNGLCIG